MNNDHKRSGDEIIARVDQKLDDLLIRFDDHLKWSSQQVMEYNKRISAIEKAWKKIEYPVLAVGLVVTGLFLWVGKSFGMWLSKHIVP